MGHSLGSTVVIRMLSAPELQYCYGPEEQRVARAVVFAPCDQAVNAVPPSLLKLLRLKGGMVTLGNLLGLFDAKVRELTKRNFQVPEFATIERQERFAHALKDYSHREAAQAILRQFVPFDRKTRRPIWPEMDRLVADYENIRVPVLIVHGAWDETLSSAMGHQLKDEIPGAMLVELPGLGHSLPTEDPLRCAKLIQRFQQGRRPADLAVGLGLVKIFAALSAVRSEPQFSGTERSSLKPERPDSLD